MVAVTGFTAARSKEIEDKAVVDGDVIGDNLVLTTKDGTQIVAGNVRGPQGLPGSPGAPGDLTLAAGDARYPKKVNLVDNLTYPFYVAHRGGHLIGGECSLESYTRNFEQRFGIEPDCQMLNDGGIAVIHDGTTTRTLKQVSGTSQTNVSQISTRTWLRDYKVLPEIDGSEYERTCTFTQLLDAFGGQVLMLPEIKVTAARIPVCDAIVARGLEKACIVQSFDINDCTYAVSRGIDAMLLNPSQSVATIQAAGIRFVGSPAVTADTYIDSLVAAGIKVFRYTVNSKTDAETMINANRAHGFFSDDPEWISGRRPVSYEDPFHKKLPWPHMVSQGARENLMFKGGGFGWRNVNTGAGTPGGPACDWCPPITSGKAKIFFEVEFGDTATSQTRWVGLAFGAFASTEDAFLDGAAAGQNAYHALMRRDGTLDIYYVGNNVAGVSVATFAGAVLSNASQSNQPWRFKFERTATAVTLTNLNNGQSVTVSNSSNLPANARFQFNFNGTEAIVRRVRVEEIP